MRTTVNNLLERLNHLQRYLAEEYIEDYQEGALNRRQALKRLGAVLGSTAAAMTVLSACAPTQPSAASPDSPPTAARAAATSAPEPATATLTPEPAAIQAAATATVLATADTLPTPAPPPGARVDADEPTIMAGDVTFPGADLELSAYQARPRGEGSFPAIMVCHENRGLTEHIRDVTRRLAVAGYLGLAVDLLSSQGGTDKVSSADQIPATLSGTPPAQLTGYFLSAMEYLKSLPYAAADRFAMVGFCFGGGMTWLVATQAPGLRAAVPFYGPNPPLDAVPGIQAAVLAIYGEDDARINAGIPTIEEAMRENGKIFEKVIYPGASHAFHNDTGRNYQPEAAADAWARTLAWFGKYV